MISENTSTVSRDMTLITGGLMVGRNNGCDKYMTNQKRKPQEKMLFYPLLVPFLDVFRSTADIVDTIGYTDDLHLLSVRQPIY